jgi:hypothetical protein
MHCVQRRTVWHGKLYFDCFKRLDYVTHPRCRRSASITRLCWPRNESQCYPESVQRTAQHSLNHTTTLWEHFGDKSRLGYIFLRPFPVVFGAEMPRNAAGLPQMYRILAMNRAPTLQIKRQSLSRQNTSSELLFCVQFLLFLAHNSCPRRQFAAVSATDNAEPRRMTQQSLSKHSGDKFGLGDVILRPFAVAFVTARPCNDFPAAICSGSLMGHTTIAFLRQIMARRRCLASIRPLLLAQKCRPHHQIAAIDATDCANCRETTRQSLSIAFDPFLRQIMARRRCLAVSFGAEMPSPPRNCCH